MKSTSTQNAVLLLPFLLIGAALADPIHAIADGAFWHHDSGWVFAGKIGEFSIVGVPQDVAGSRDAVAYYARGVGAARTVIAVEVYPADSALPHASIEEAKAHAGAAVTTLAVGAQASRTATRVAYVAGAGAATIYFAEAGEWRVRIEVDAPSPGEDSSADFDAAAKMAYDLGFTRMQISTSESMLRGSKASS